MGKRIAILQPEVPHYRTEFFERLSQQCEVMDLFVYNSLERTRTHGFNINENERLNVNYIANKNVHEVLLYNPQPLLGKQYDTLVLMLHFAHLTTWLLLLTKWLHRKKIILWGQGISVKRYLKESKKPDWKLKWMIALADGVWIYEEPEARQWQAIFPHKPIVALNNTLSGVEEMCSGITELRSYGVTELRNDSLRGKEDIKKKWGITQETVLIFCARFENNYRRTDLLVEAIERLDAEKNGFIIIGEGKNKPDFTKYKNVHDFGAVYDNEIKRELFAAADIYFQPGWVGLSIVEAMAYGKPIFTFKRSEETLQCVEYCYIKDGKNGLIFDNMEDCIDKISHLTTERMEAMGAEARKLVQEKLTPRQMAEHALSIL